MDKDNHINKRNTINFNKELLFGEIGAIIGAPLASYLISLFTYTPRYIAFSAVLGGIFVEAIFWLSMRLYDKNTYEKYSVKNLGEDIIYFTPVAFLVALFIYYPILFFGSEYLIRDHYRIIYSVISSQFVAFAFFLGLMNVYRYFLAKYFRKVL